MKQYKTSSDIAKTLSLTSKPKTFLLSTLHLLQNKSDSKSRSKTGINCKSRDKTIDAITARSLMKD